MSGTPSPERTAVLAFTLLVFSMGIGRFAFTPLLPLMQEEGLLTVGNGGVLASVHFLGYAIGALCSGYPAVSSRKSLQLSMLLIALTTMAMGLVDSFAVWLVARFVAGVCSAFVLVAISTHIIRYLAEVNRAGLQGLVFAGVGGGIAIVGLAVLGLMASQLSSNVGWVCLGLVTLIVTVLVHRSASARLFKSSGSVPSVAIGGLSLPWHIILPYGAMGAGYVIPATFLPIMAKQSVESPMLFGWGWPIFGMAAVVSTVLVAGILKRYSNRTIWIISQVVMAAGLALPALWPQLLAVIAGGVCVGGTFMVITMVAMKESHRVARSAQTQILVAMMTASFALGQIIGPILAGWAYDLSDSFASPLLFASALLLISLVPMLVSRSNDS